MATLLIDNYKNGSVVITRQSGANDRYGQPVWLPATPHGGRIEYRQHQVRNGQGELQSCEGIAYLAASVTAQPGDLCTTSDGRTWEVVVSIAQSGFSKTYQEIHFGSIGKNV